MAADVNDLVCLGFGSWSSVNWVVTLGYGNAIEPNIPGYEYRVSDNRTHFKVADNRTHGRVADNRPHFKLPDLDV